MTYAILDELDEAQKALEEEQARLHHALGTEATTTPKHERTKEVRHCIISDIHGTFIAKRASQNLATAVALLRAGPEPRTSEEKKLYQHLQTLHDTAAEQQV
jgi:hypothetical protein